MITKSDLFKSSWEYEKINEDIEKQMGNYLYECLKIPLISKVVDCYWYEGKWLVETDSDMNEYEEDMSFAVFKGRGTLEKLMAR